ncbi:alpha/beta hydrolase-fold protein [Olivibacter sp. XZL3]|uniref:alpha/beta hydrolase-fold protein n=1 Tax=Olivibacter sp. XZL3 TaxID=1735116 RepID=UPI0010658D0C|nr:alpha/beta hydrolase-fold protein [Olivibacter sp. XZL3]
MKRISLFCLLLAVGFPFGLWSQVRFTGRVIDSQHKKPLAYVNVGIRDKNIGTLADQTGVFLLLIPPGHEADTLSFSLVGYKNSNIPIKNLESGGQQIIALEKKSIELDEVEVAARQSEERRFGIKRRGLLMHFADGMFNKDDSFEIGQLIKLGAHPVKINTVNLYLLESRPDSAIFRINFYGYRDGKPAERIVEKSIVQRKAIKKGWLSFDLSKEHIQLSGDVVVTLEFLPDQPAKFQPISYEVKLGGSSKSFYRRSSLGSWSTPPHHYCLNLSGVIDRAAPVQAEEDVASEPTFILPSAVTNTAYSIFLHLPEGYTRDTSSRYPLLLLLDGNAYFDAMKEAVIKRKNKVPNSIQPILVGIGYENAYVMDSLRVRDYTFPNALPADSFATSGGAARFYRFINDELLPHIDSGYRTQRNAGTIMGHSFGGYFVLYAFARQLEEEADRLSELTNYVAASPSISYRDGYIVRQLRQQMEKTPPKKKLYKKLYLTMGEEELADDTTGLFNQLKVMPTKGGGMEIKTKEYKHTDHMGTAIPSFEDALKEDHRFR